MSEARWRDAFFDDARAFVDQREHQALHDLVVGDLARRDALGAVLGDHLLDQLGGDRGSRLPAW